MLRESGKTVVEGSTNYRIIIIIMAGNNEF